MPPRKPRSTRNGRVTMQDVADRAGVSAITVSRALRTPHKVAPLLRERILLLCREMGYVLNHAASALASARSHAIVVLIPSLANVVFIDIIAGIKEELEAHGYHMLLGVTGYGADAEETMLRTYLQHAPDGAILTGTDHADGVWRLLRTHRVPAVHTIENLPASHAGMSVGFSQFDAGLAAGRHLVERGYRRIGILGAHPDPRSLRRREGCRTALQEAGLHDPALEISSADDTSIGLGAQLLSQLRQAHPDCDALFVCNDDLAQGALFQCARLGIAVPREMGLVGFHDLSGSAWTTPPLSTIATPRRRMGATAARMLVQHLAGEPLPQRHVDVGFELMRRETS
ncbi:LacI family DNA-binding transcriptional regulator [Bordetella genomosp. 13]|uniref:LacI family DNA-binding transcriptional regulator n=1 Tax=Bordetella genomosp. 13 TaxID=463040 RepID=UPI0011A237EE|nr:LacI family DNA-binding transcriptional regulator [Bordetella genomosp. 13]